MVGLLAGYKRMPTTFDALSIILFLLPGLFVERITEAFAVRKRPTVTTRVVDGLLYCLVSYVAYLLVVVTGWIKLEVIPVGLWKEGTEEAWKKYALSYLALNGVALVVGLVHSFMLVQGLYYKLLRALGVTRKSGRIDVWHDFHTQARGRWYRIFLTNGTLMVGGQDHYSHEPDKRELCLWNVRIREKSGLEYVVDSVYLTEEGVERMEVIREDVPEPRRDVQGVIQEEMGRRPTTPRPALPLEFEVGARPTSSQPALSPVAVPPQSTVVNVTPVAAPVPTPGSSAGPVTSED